MTPIAIVEAYIVCWAGFHFLERSPRIDASGETVEQLSLPFSHWLIISPEPSRMSALSCGKLIVTFSLPAIRWKPATMAGSPTSSFLSDPQHMLSVTGVASNIRNSVFLFSHQSKVVFFSVSVQVSFSRTSWVRTGAEAVTRQMAAMASILVVPIVRPPLLQVRAQVCLSRRVMTDV
jgi:hypothetical protein